MRIAGGTAKRITKRIINFIFVIWGVVTLSFCLQVFTGTDPAEMIVRKVNVFATEEQIQAVREELGLDAPFLERYADYIKGVLTGDLGTAITNRQPVIENIKDALPVTCMLVVMAMAWVIIFALFVGCYSSYKGGLLDEVMRILCDILMAFPLIVIAMALVSAVDNSVASVIIAIGISMLAWFLRMVRSYAKTECGKEYIEAARIAGASGLRIVLRHLIPNVFPQFVVYFTTGIATAIMSVSSFAFLGVGLIAGTPEWGAMLNEARNSVYSNPALLIYPGICLIVCCAGFNLLGEGLRDAIGKEDDICVA